MGAAGAASGEIKTCISFLRLLLVYDWLGGASVFLVCCCFSLFREAKAVISGRRASEALVPHVPARDAFRNGYPVPLASTWKVREVWPAGLRPGRCHLINFLISLLNSFR